MRRMQSYVSNQIQHAGRERQDGLDCWTAVTTEEYAQQLLSEKPLTRNGAYVAQTQEYLADTAMRIWTAVKGVLGLPAGKLHPNAVPESFAYTAPN